jgi:hypothetical protein
MPGWQLRPSHSSVQPDEQSAAVPLNPRHSTVLASLQLGWDKYGHIYESDIRSVLC